MEYHERWPTGSGEEVSHTGSVIGISGSLVVFDCKVCGYAHLSPLPEDRSKFVEEHFYDGEDGWFEKEASEQLYWNLWHDWKLSFLPGPLLDVGCGAGWLVKRALDKGIIAWGIEPNKSAFAVAQSLVDRVSPLSLTDMVDFPPLFSSIHMRLVLEHLVDPLSALRKARELLKPDGMLYAEVPNDFSLLQRLTRKKPWWIQETHVNYFNRQSLGRLLESAGFKVEKWYANFPMELFILMGRDYVENPELGKKCHEARMKMEMRHLWLIGYKMLVKMGIGRHVIAVARRV